MDLVAERRNQRAGLKFSGRYRQARGNRAAVRGCEKIVFQTDEILSAVIVFVKFVEFVARKDATNSTNQVLHSLRES